jgi:hypothetical protein
MVLVLALDLFHHLDVGAVPDLKFGPSWTIEWTIEWPPQSLDILTNRSSPTILIFPTPVESKVGLHHLQQP